MPATQNAWVLPLEYTGSEALIDIPSTKAKLHEKKNEPESKSRQELFPKGPYRSNTRHCTCLPKKPSRPLNAEDTRKNPLTLTFVEFKPITPARRHSEGNEVQNDSN
jgi:hypothetical protein